MLQRYIGSQFWPIASSVAHKHLLTCFDRSLSKCCHSIHRASFPVLGLTHSDGFPQPHRTHFPAFSWPHLMRSLSQPAQDWIAENPPHRWHQSTDQHIVHEIHGAPFCRLLEMAQTVDNAFHACLIVQRLTTLHNAGDTEVANIDVVLQDDRLKNVERVLNNSAKYRGSSTYLRTLEELYPITSLDCTIIQSIVNWVSYDMLCDWWFDIAVHFHHAFCIHYGLRLMYILHLMILTTECARSNFNITTVLLVIERLMLLI